MDRLIIVRPCLRRTNHMKYYHWNVKLSLKLAWSQTRHQLKFLGPNHICGTTEATVVKF